MRRWVWGLTFVPVFAASAAACGDDAPPEGGPSADAGAPTDGAPPRPGDDGGRDGEALSPDAEAGPGNVVVTIRGAAGPMLGVTVVFHDPSGAVIDTRSTAADGTATSEVTSSFVSALFSQNNEHVIVTWSGVESGDRLSVFDPTEHAPVAAYDVALAGDVDGGADYLVSAGSCLGEGPGPSVPLPLFHACVGSPGAVLATAYGDSDAPLAFGFKKGITPPAPGTSVPVTTDAWVVPSSITVSVANAQANPQALRFSQVAGGLAFETGLTKLEAGAATFPIAPGFADGLQGSFFVDGSSEGAWRAVSERVAPGHALALDFAAALPEIASPTVGGGDAQRPVVSWTGDTSGTSGGVVRLLFTGTAPAEGYEWRLVVPPGATSVTAPALPADAASFLPAAGGDLSVFATPEVGFVKTDILAGYGSFRQLPGVLDWVSGRYRAPALPKDGALSLTFAGRPAGLD